MDALLHERIVSKIVPEPNSGCWLWIGASSRKSGYGTAYLEGGKPVYAHRYVYSLLVGEPPAGLQADHLCRVRCCVNPKHIEFVTQRINVLRGSGTSAINARKTECIRGHAFDESNTIIRDDGQRGCRACRDERMASYGRDYYQSKKAHLNDLRRSRRRSQRSQAR